MKKKLVSLLLALALCLGLTPVTASAAENQTLPDWYFLFAIFKNIDADGKDRNGKAVHVTYSMSQDEVNVVRENAKEFEEYMNSVGVMRAHMDVVEIDEPITELADRDDGSYLNTKLAAPLLKNKVDLDRYDHVTGIVSLNNLDTKWLGLGGVSLENGTGYSCINIRNRENALKNFTAENTTWSAAGHVHEFLHFMENQTKKFGAKFGLHDVRINHYMPDGDEGKECYRDIMLNRARGTDGTGVHPITWQYPPHVTRTMTEWNVPSGVTGIGKFAFANNKTLTRVTIPSSVTSIGGAAFQGCSNLTSISLPAAITRVEGYTFANCSKLTDIYYGGTEEQWKAIPVGTSNSVLGRAAIHYNHLLADVKTTDRFAQPIAWALGQGITGGTGGGKFSPGDACTQAQILTFLHRAKGSPKPAGAVTGDKYYASAVQWAREQGLIDETFSADAPCTRAMAVTYLWKLAGSPQAAASSFTDVPAGADYAGAVSWAVEKGVTSGAGADTFAPGSACTRGQIVTFLYRALGQE